MQCLCGSNISLLDLTKTFDKYSVCVISSVCLFNWSCLIVSLSELSHSASTLRAVQSHWFFFWSKHIQKQSLLCSCANSIVYGEYQLFHTYCCLNLIMIVLRTVTTASNSILVAVLSCLLLLLLFLLLAVSLSPLQGRTHIFKIHAAKMNVDKDIRYELLARLCPNSTGNSLITRVIGYLATTLWMLLASMNSWWWKLLSVHAMP